MKPIKPIIQYITPLALRDYFDDLFKVKLIINYEIYSKITPYVVQTKDNKGKIKSLSQTLILNKILITRDINFDNKNEIMNSYRILDGIPTDLKIFHSKIIFV